MNIPQTKARRPATLVRATRTTSQDGDLRSASRLGSQVSLQPASRIARRTTEPPIEIDRTNTTNLPLPVRPSRYTTKQPVTADVAATRGSNRGRTADVDAFDEDDALYATRPSSSALRYNYLPPTRGDEQEGPKTELGLYVQRRRASVSRPTDSGMISQAVVPHVARTQPVAARRSPIAIILIGIMAIVVLVTLGRLVGSWWQVHQDDTQYGRPRTFQMDAVVGHGDSQTSQTHFIFLNLHGRIQIIEISAGEASHTHIYTGPVLFGGEQELAPVTADPPVDVNGDGKPDLIVHIQEQRIVYINDGTGFRPLKNGEKVTLP